MPDFLNNIVGFDSLEQTNPTYFKFINKYFTELGGTSGEVAGIKDINELGMKMVTHYIGNALTPLNLSTYNYSKDKNSEKFLSSVKNKVEQMSEFIPSVPDEVWSYLATKHRLDNSGNSLGQNLRNLSAKIAQDLANNNAEELAESIDKLFDLYRDATERNAF